MRKVPPISPSAIYKKNVIHGETQSGTIHFTKNRNAITEQQHGWPLALLVRGSTNITTYCTHSSKGFDSTMTYGNTILSIPNYNFILTVLIVA
jgi:hypothetical protein